MQPTNTQDPAYFHKVVDCQWACPAHTPVPEYIRLIAQQRYADAYMINWVSNVFPGILGRTCDRPCEPACRRGRVEEENAEQPEPVAICRLKRVAADLKDDVVPRMPRPSGQRRSAGADGNRGDGPQRQVWVLQDGAPKPVRVKTGISDGRVTEVKSDELRTGMQVVADRITSGAKP